MLLYVTVVYVLVHPPFSSLSTRNTKSAEMRVHPSFQLEDHPAVNWGKGFSWCGDRDDTNTTRSVKNETLFSLLGDENYINYVWNCINSNMTLILAEVGLDHDNMRPHGIARQAQDISDLKRSSPIETTQGHPNCLVKISENMLMDRRHNFWRTMPQGIPGLLISLLSMLSESRHCHQPEINLQSISVSYLNSLKESHKVAM